MTCRQHGQLGMVRRCTRAIRTDAGVMRCPRIGRWLPHPQPALACGGPIVWCDTHALEACGNVAELERSTVLARVDETVGPQEAAGSLTPHASCW